MPSIRYNAKLTGAFYFQAPPSFVRSSRTEGEPAEIIVVLSGCYRAFSRDLKPTGMLEARAGDVIYWPAGMQRTEENPGGNQTRCIALYFQWRRMPLTCRCLRDRGLLILSLAERIVELHLERHRNTLETQNALLNALLAHYLEAATVREPEWVMRIAHYVDDHPTEQTRLRNIADHLERETHHVSRRYKQLTGRTVMDDVRRRKVEHARHLLLSEPAMTLAELATRTGIGDEHQLSRLLKRYTGMSARDWKRLARKTKA